MDDVEELIAETRQRGVFELTKAIGEGNVERALRLLANMQRNREPALRIQFMLVRQLRQIWRAKELAAAGVPRPEIAVAGRHRALLPRRRAGAGAPHVARDAGAQLRAALPRRPRAQVIARRPDLILSKLVQSLAEDAGAAPLTAPPPQAPGAPPPTSGC